MRVGEEIRPLNLELSKNQDFFFNNHQSCRAYIYPATTPIWVKLSSIDLPRREESKDTLNFYASSRAFWSFRLTCVVPPQITRHNHYLHIGQVGLPYFSRGSFKYLPLFLSCGVSHIFRIFFFFFTYPIFIFFCAHLKKSTTPNYKYCWIRVYNGRIHIVPWTV